MTDHLSDYTKITAAEESAGVTPVNCAYPPGDVRRYGAIRGADHKYVRAFCLTIFALCVAMVAQAQRSTPCNAATPNNAICVIGNPVTTDTNGNTITGVTYRVEQRTGSSGAFATAQTNLTVPRAYIQNLAPGEYQFRMFASCATCTAESAPSNIADGTATQVPKIPSAPVITIAVVISADHAPVYRVVNGERKEFAGLVPVGHPCQGKVLFRFRDKGYRRVAVTAANLEGLSPSAVYAAPCAKEHADSNS